MLWDEVTFRSCTVGNALGITLCYRECDETSQMVMKQEKSSSEHGMSYVIARTWGHTSDTGNMDCHAATQIAHHPT